MKLFKKQINLKINTNNTIECCSQMIKNAKAFDFAKSIQSDFVGPVRQPRGGWIGFSQIQNDYKQLIGL